MLALPTNPLRSLALRTNGGYQNHPFASRNNSLLPLLHPTADRRIGTPSSRNWEPP